MPGQNSIKTCLSVWAGLLGMCAIAFAQFPQNQGQQCFGVMGQVAEPGTYALDSPRPVLGDLVSQAGGLTQRATHRLRIIRIGAGGPEIIEAAWESPLQPGDIVVADGPHLSAAGAGEAYQQVALVHLIDRPVILPVPAAHANLPAILAYLGQDPALAGQVQVIPGTMSAATSRIAGLSVLNFESAPVQRLQLPELPEVFRVAHASEPSPLEVPPLALSFPAEAPIPPQRFQRPAVNAMVMPPDAMSEAKPLPGVRELGKDHSSADLLETPLEMDVPRSKASLDAVLARNVDEENQAESPRSSWWPWVGLVLLAVACCGIYAKLFWPNRSSRRWAIPVPAPEVPALGKPAALDLELPEPAAEKALFSPGIFPIRDDALRALVFNTLPVVEESRGAGRSAPTESKPKSPPVFRLDLPEKPPRIKTPYLVNRPAKPAIKVDEPEAAVPAKPAEPQSPWREVAAAKTDRPQGAAVAAAVAETKVASPSSTLGILDRVLQRVHEKRAA